MKKSAVAFAVCLLATLMPMRADAEFIVSNAILEFNSDNPSQQDVELISRSSDSDYIDTEIREVVHGGQADEAKMPIDNLADSELLVTPDKTILAAGNRKVLRFVLLKALDEKEHVYFVAVKPVIKGAENTSKVGLKILVGYEVLVIVRPAQMEPASRITRNGKSLTVENIGNTSLLLQNGQQCGAVNNCKLLPVQRVYPGQKKVVELPFDMPATYSVWDGRNLSEKRLD